MVRVRKFQYIYIYIYIMIYHLLVIYPGIHFRFSFFVDIFLVLLQTVLVRVVVLPRILLHLSRSSYLQ